MQEIETRWNYKWLDRLFQAIPWQLNIPLGIIGCITGYYVGPAHTSVTPKQGAFLGAIIGFLGIPMLHMLLQMGINVLLIALILYIFYWGFLKP